MSRYIDAEYLTDTIGAMIGYGTTPTDIWDMVGKAPSIDIVRCQDCKHWVYNFNGCSRNPCTEPWYATDFCNYGEREGE